MDDAETTASNSSLPRTSSSAATSPTRLNLIRRPDLTDEFQRAGFVLTEPEIGAQSAVDAAKIDIIAVPAIGAHPIRTWIRRNPFDDVDDDEPQNAISNAPTMAILGASRKQPNPKPKPPAPWIVQEVRTEMPDKARVLLYNHGMPEEGQELQDFADELLRHVTELRRKEGDNRALVFICHSTGGLVVKTALIKMKEDPFYDAMLARCFGVVFLATPHLGSSYLSSLGYASTIGNAMRSIWYLPESTQAQLEVNHPFLLNLMTRFKSTAADLKIWTFWETKDTNLTNESESAEEKLFFHAPISSKISSILRLRSEDAFPLLSNHADAASFGSETPHTKTLFIRQLNTLADRAIKLCSEGHVKMRLKEQVDVEIHGFYDEYTKPRDPDARFMRLYSTSKKLEQFIELGLDRSLEDRFKENTPYPETRQFSRAHTRAKSLNDGVLASVERAPKELDPSKSRRSKSHFLGVPGNAEASADIPSIEVAPLTEAALKASAHGIGPTHHEAPADDSIHNDARLETRIIPPTPEAPVIPGLSVTDNDASSTASGASRPLIPRAYSGPPGTSAPTRPFHKHSLTPPKHELPKINTNTAVLNRKSKKQKKADRRISPVPIRSDRREQKITWIHLPYNNPPWDVLASIRKNKSKQYWAALLQNRFWGDRHVWARHTEHHACFVEPGCILVHPNFESSPVDSIDEFVTSRPGSSTSNHDDDDPGLQLSLFLPYLHWDTYKKMIKRRMVVKERLDRGRARPVPRDIGQLNDLELRISWMYLAYNPPYNCRRTLDQFGYPHLNDTRARDDDQMLYKMTKERDENYMGFEWADAEFDSDESDSDDPGLHRERQEREIDNLKDGKVLMVDQLWLFITDLKTVTTFFPARQGDADEDRAYEQMDLRNSIYNEVNADLSTRCETAVDLAGVIALHAVNLMFRRDTIHELQVFRIFEESISVLVEKMTKSFKYFRAKGFRATTEGFDEEKESIIIRRHKKEGEQFQRLIRDNTSALLELRDIGDELKTLDRLFEQQQSALEKLRNWLGKLGFKSTVGYDAVNHALRKLEEFRHRIAEMLQRTDDTKNDFEKLLELIQRQANVDEARLTRWQADLTNSQTRALNIFTVFTVIFLPLSFFTSLFGMNTVEFNSGTLRLSQIALWSLPLSAFLIIVTFILAFSTTVRSIVMYIIKFPLHPMEKYDPNEEAREMLRRIEYQRRKAKLRRLNDLDSDARVTDQTRPPQQVKHRVRRYHKLRHHDNFQEIDFWKDNHAVSNPLYEIPRPNRKRSATDMMLGSGLMPPTKSEYATYESSVTVSAVATRDGEKERRGEALLSRLWGKKARQDTVAP